MTKIFTNQPTNEKKNHLPQHSQKISPCHSDNQPPIPITHLKRQTRFFFPDNSEGTSGWKISKNEWTPATESKVPLCSLCTGIKARHYTFHSPRLPRVSFKKGLSAVVFTLMAHSLSRALAVFDCQFRLRDWMALLLSAGLPRGRFFRDGGWKAV